MVRFARICVAVLYAMGAVNTSVVWLLHDVFHLIESATPAPTLPNHDSDVHDNASAVAHGRSEHEHSHDENGHTHGADRARVALANV